MASQHSKFFLDVSGALYFTMPTTVQHPAFFSSATKYSLGMRFGETAYHCIECSVDFCAPCQSSHAMTAHASAIVRITSYSWPPPPEVANAVASCSQCSLEIKCRIECSDCLQCICLACHGMAPRRQSWFRHRDQHQRIKGFIHLLPPSQNVVPPANHDCECLTMTGCISHCERCSTGKLPSHRSCL